MPDDITYEYLDPAQRASILQNRLTALEQDHFNVKMDVQAAGSQGNHAQEQRLQALTATITDMRAEKKKADDDAKAAAS